MTTWINTTKQKKTIKLCKTYKKKWIENKLKEIENNNMRNDVRSMYKNI